MLKTLCHKVELFNAYCDHNIKLEQLKEAALNIQTEVISCLADSICLIRHFQTPSTLSRTTKYQEAIDYQPDSKAEDEKWQPLIDCFAATSKYLDEINQRVEHLLHVARRIEDLKREEKFLNCESY